MRRESGKSVRQQIIGPHAEWIKRFDVIEYVDNPPLIEKLHEEKQLALVDVADLKKQLESANLQNQQLSHENQSLSHLLREALARSTLSFFLSLVSMVLVGIGVNVATNSPKSWIGWVMTTLGCIVQVVAYFARQRGRNE